MISLEANKVTRNHPLELSLEMDFWIISIRFLNSGAHSKLTLACSLIASCISSWHHDGHIIPAFVIYHIHGLHLHKSLHYHTSSFSMPTAYILFALFAYHVHSCIVSHALHFPLQKPKKKKRTKRKSQ